MLKQLKVHRGSRLVRATLRNWLPLVKTKANFATCPLAEGLSNPLKVVDPDIANLIEQEKKRQKESVVLIPSENFTSKAVMEALGSVMQNKYSEGYPGARYYGGNEFIDQVESLCQKRALKAFNLDPVKWGVNVQALSGAPANLYVYYALAKPGGRIMGLDLPHGGHLSHGYQTSTKKISAVSAYYETMPYRLDETTGLIHYDELARTSMLYRPKVIVAGASAYPRLIDYKRMKKIADNCGAYLMTDMAHISGMVATGAIPSPFEFSDVVTTTTHKSLRGPRGAMIFYRKGIRSVSKSGKQLLYDLETPINASVFPGHQGGPHNHSIAALAVALKQANSPEFKTYQSQVLLNCAEMAKHFQMLGYELVSGGTDTHLLLIDLRKKEGIDGARVERVLELCNIAVNKNTVPGDVSALIPGGIRLGSPAMTSRGLKEGDFQKISDFVHQGIIITQDIQSKLKAAKVKEFQSGLKDGSAFPAISHLRKEVISFLERFPRIGI